MVPPEVTQTTPTGPPPVPAANNTVDRYTVPAESHPISRRALTFCDELGIHRSWGKEIGDRERLADGAGVAGDEAGEACGDGVAVAEGRRGAEEGRRFVLESLVRRGAGWIHGRRAMASVGHVSPMDRIERGRGELTELTHCDLSPADGRTKRKSERE